jgi:hypothetical protein
MGFPLLQKPAEMCVGRQIQVLVSYWTGRMSNEEANSLHKCTVREYHVLDKWDAGGTPSQQKMSNSRLVQVYMSKQPGMDTQKVLEYQYITAETLYKTYIREANDVVKLPTRQMSPSKTQKMSGGSMIFRGASARQYYCLTIRTKSGNSC